MQNDTQRARSRFNRILGKSVLLAVLTSLAGTSFAQTDNRVYFNKTADATLYSSESNPQDDSLVRNMGTKVGYIKHSTSITFKEFVL